MSVHSTRKCTTKLHTSVVLPGWDSEYTVGTVNRLRAWQQSNRESIPGIEPPIQWESRALFTWIKRQGQREEWLELHLHPPMPSWPPQRSLSSRSIIPSLVRPWKDRTANLCSLTFTANVYVSSLHFVYPTDVTPTARCLKLENFKVHCYARF